jgi:hypothetical protein
MQAETKPTSLTLHISLLEARDLAIGRGSPPVCTEAHKVREGLVDVKQHGEIAEYRICSHVRGPLGSALTGVGVEPVWA